MSTSSAPALYVHIPFCLSRCGYCAFVSGLYDEEAADRYLETVRRELAARGLFSGGAGPSSIFVGGGTPSVLTPVQLDGLFSWLPAVVDGGEVTCEINPDSATREKLTILRDRGVNRVSFGVQTFSDEGLALLGRRHTAARAEWVIGLARELGFTRVSVDLINGWPGQTEEGLAADLARVVGLGLEHVSCYNFILEEDAAGYGRYLGLMEGGDGDERGRRFWDIVEEWLCGRGGLRHYEVSNFARPGCECRHNIHVWEGGEYGGLGLSAVGYVGGRRYGNVADMDAYLRWSGGDGGVGVEDWVEELKGEERARECAVFWLRLFEGVDLKGFREKTGIDFLGLYGDVVAGFLSGGIMEYGDDGRRIRVAKRYMPVLDGVLVDLV